MSTDHAATLDKDDADSKSTVDEEGGGLSFVTVNDPRRFRTSGVRQLVKRHVRRDMQRRSTAKSLKTSAESEEREEPPDERQKTYDTQDNARGHKVLRLDSSGLEEVSFPESSGPLSTKVDARRRFTSASAQPLYVYPPDKLPRFKDTTLDAHFFLDFWFKAFARCIPEQYLISLFGSELALLSYTSIAASFHSIVHRQPGCSVAYLAIRQEAIQKINEALRMSNYSDETIMSIKHQLFIDMFLGSAKTLKSHVEALAQLVSLRTKTGPGQAGIQHEVAHFVKCHVLLACVIAGTRLPLVIRQMDTIATPFLDPICETPENFNESPLKWLTEHMSSLVQSPNCTPKLHSLCCELRDLTRTLLYYGAVPPAAENSNYQQLVLHHFHPGVDSDSTFNSKRERQAAWVYETCRLAGLIYATAIVQHLPISKAWRKAASDFQTQHIVEDLAAAMFNTEYYTDNQVWGDLIGIYMWAAFVTGAAGHQSSDNLEEPQKTEEILKRCLLTQPIVYSFGLFHDPALVEASMETVLTFIRVQEILATKATIPTEADGTPSPSSTTNELPIRLERNALYNMTTSSCTRRTFKPETYKAGAS